MDFKVGNYIDEASLTGEEALVFVAFLEKEIARHKAHMLEYQEIATSDYHSTFFRIVAQTVVVRNLEDIQHTQRTIDYLKNKFHFDKVCSGQCGCGKHE